MKPFAKYFIVLACLLPASAALAGTPAPEITFNGVTTIFGDARALFKVRDAKGVEKFYFLSAGQHDGEVELVAFDVLARTITVRDGDVVQTLRLYDAPEISAGAKTSGGSVPGRRNAAAASTDQAGFVAGVETGSGSAAIAPDVDLQAAGGNHHASEPSAADVSNPSNPSTAADDGENGATQNPANAQDISGTDSPVNPETGKIDPLWVSRQVEAARIRMAEEVRSGRMEPFPSTPLTPANAPPDLVSTNSIQAIPVMQ